MTSNITKNFEKFFSLKTNLFILLFVINSFDAVAGPESPEFVRTKDWQINKLESGNMVFTAKAVFYNPNKAKAKLKSIVLDIFTNDKKIGTVTQIEQIKIKGQSPFDIPLRLEFNLRESGIDVLGTILNLMSNNKFLVDIKGYLKLNVFCIPFKVEINEQEEFSINDFLN